MSSGCLDHRLPHQHTAVYARLGTCVSNVVVSALPLSLHSAHINLQIHHKQLSSPEVLWGLSQCCLCCRIQWSGRPGGHHQLCGALWKESSSDEWNVIDFSCKALLISTVNIQGEDICGTSLQNRVFTFHTNNTDDLFKKSQNRFHLLRKPRSFDVCRAWLKTFYDTVVASAILYAVVFWGSGFSERDRKRLNKLMRRAGYVLGSSLDSVQVMGGDGSWSIPLLKQ